MLYHLLEQEVIPEFYARDEQGIPDSVGRTDAGKYGEVNASILRQSRGARIYRATLPSGRERLSFAHCQQRAIGRQMVESQHGLEKKWNALHFGEIKVETRGGQHVFEVQVFLNDLDPQAVRVELCADGVRDKAPVRQEMKLFAHSTGQ